ncbi:MAG TPA: ATP-binding protein [Actinomycetota bacterium]|nr:ATP-binding protein [Actinomycetota bacterium]
MPASNTPDKRRTLTGRLLLVHSVTLVGILLALGVVLERVLAQYFIGQLTDSLTSQARGVQTSLAERGPVKNEVVRLGRAIGARTTVIRTDGVVVADSQQDPATMANHRNRPEVRAALEGRVGVSSRLSATVGTAFRYVALPAADGRIVRVALPLTTVDSKIRTVRAILTAGFGLAAIIGVVVLAVIAGGLLRPLQEITSAVARAGETEDAPPVPEHGTEELVVLARTVNRMRGELEQRILALKEEQRTRDVILSALEEGVALIGDGDEVLYRNDRAAELTAALADGTRVPHAFRALVTRARRDGSSAIAEFSVPPHPRIVQGLAVPIASRSQVLVVLRDVSEARQADRVRREFVANASHELKTPVASIRALAETIGETVHADPPATPRFARQLEREALRLSEIVSDLLDLSRLTSETGLAGKVDVSKVVAEEVHRQADRAREAGVSLDFSGEGRHVVVFGNDADMALLVRNLLDNAIRYTGEGGAVHVSLARNNGEAVLAVRDTGMGIPSRDQSRIFERFYRVDRARSRETGGTGLGLSIVKHVAENHGGSVSVESELGRGSTFTVRIPAASA